MAAPSLNNTISDEFANSYVDLEEADDFWASHHSTTKSDTWSELTDEQKTSLLITACSLIEMVRFTEPTQQESFLSNSIAGRTLFRDYGRPFTIRPCRYSPTQALQFPRNLDVNTEDNTPYIPEPIRRAQCEQAMYTYTFDDSIIASRMQGVQREGVTLGEMRISTTFRDGSIGSSLSPVALDLIRRYILKSSLSIGRG